MRFVFVLKGVLSLIILGGLTGFVDAGSTKIYISATLGSVDGVSTLRAAAAAKAAAAEAVTAKAARSATRLAASAAGPLVVEAGGGIIACASNPDIAFAPDKPCTALDN